LGVAGEAIGCEAERSQQPGPNRPLVVAAITFQNPAAVMRVVRGTSERKRAQSVCGEKTAPARPHDTALIGGSERTMRQAHREYLIRPDVGIVAVGAIDHVVQTLTIRAHEARKALLCGLRRGTEAIRLPQNFR